MAEFEYKARDASGRAATGVLEGDTEGSVAAALLRSGFTPISISEKKTGGLQSEIKIPFLSDRVGLKDIAVSSRQLATMINSGLPLLRALTVLEEQTESKALSKIWGEVRVDVSTGRSFSNSLRKHPRVFNNLFVSMVAAGEIGGVLDETLMRVAETLEKQVALRQKVRSAMTYPVMVAGMVFLILVAILLFVVPSFEQLYADLGGTLPLPTRILLLMSKIVQRFFPLVVLGMVVGAVALTRFIKTDAGRIVWDRFKLEVPIFGELMRKVAMSRFARTLGVLLNSGVPVLQALDITQETVLNVIVARALEDVEASVREGESLSRPLERHKVFPAMVVQMLAVGEETGAVDPMLSKVADFYDREVEATVEGLTSLIEPLLIAVLGGVVGTILIALYLPMFRIINLIQ